MTTAAARRLELVPLDDLVPADRNPKLHDDDGIDASLEAFGYIEPIVLDERTGKLVVGHGRWTSLLGKRDAGADPPEGIVVGDDGEWRVPVLRGWASDSDAQAEAYLVASNHLTTKGGWQMDDLTVLLDELRGQDMLALTGFDSTELDDLLAHFGPPPGLDELEDRYGDPDPSHLWPVLRFKVPPTVRDRYLRFVDGIEGGDDALFDALLTAAESTVAGSKPKRGR